MDEIQVIISDESYTDANANVTIVCPMKMCFFWLSTQQIYQKLNQSNITVLHWFYLVTATSFFLWGGAYVTRYCGHFLAYCTAPDDR
jgi:hypothetical protein